MSERASGSSRNCTVCGQRISPNSRHRNFCSEECLREYEQLFSSPKKSPRNSLSLAEELYKLQEMVQYEAQRAPHQTGDRNQMVAFYQDVVERTGRILKWLNAHALTGEENQRRQLETALKENDRLTKKLEILLQKAADLKRANNQLRKKIAQKTDVQGFSLARQVLGVEAGDDPKIIKKAFRQKAKLVHPDREYGDADLFKTLKIAYHLLADSAKK